jgi:hypothetical protein
MLFGLPLAYFEPFRNVDNLSFAYKIGTEKMPFAIFDVCVAARLIAGLLFDWVCCHFWGFSVSALSLAQLAARIRPLCSL